MYSFSNDYAEGAAPEILEALQATNLEQTPGYTEGDIHCEHARKLIAREIGRSDCMIEFCIGGTSANIVGVTGLLHDWEGVICTPDAHINVHETGAIAACGRTVLSTRDTDGFLSPEEAERVWEFQTSTGRHMTRPAAIYISNSTELGGVWSRERFDAICNWADSHELAVFVDGARIGSALCSQDNDLELSHIAERAGAFTIGGTKNGALFGEAMVIRHERLKEAFPYLIKERGGLLAKGRLLGVQFETLFEDGLFWRLATHANKMALRLREELISLGYAPYLDSPSNQQFFITSPEQAEVFGEEFDCYAFYTLEDGRKVVRFVCSWATSEAAVNELVERARQIA